MKATIHYLRTQKTIIREDVTGVSFTINRDLVLDFRDGSWQVFPKDTEVLIDIKEN